MKKDNQILKINDDVQWIGILDYEIETFDVVMKTEYGTTYNSYFINAEKKTIIETSKETFKDTYLEKIKKVCDPAEIEYIVLNHTEPDHSGNLKHLLQLAPNATVVGSGQALNYLNEMVGFSFKSLKVKDGDVLDLGNKKLRVIGAPNLHWPDSIYTYLEEDKILFTCDSFGAHYCNEDMFNDVVGNYDDAFKYYFDVILKPFSKFMLKAIEKISSLEIKTICPGHGPILRTDWKKYVDLSEKWAKEYLESTITNKRVLIAYVSAYGYTKEMAERIKTGIQQYESIRIEILDIENMLLGELEEELVQSDALIIGSPTINQNTLLPVYKLFSVINPIRDKGKLFATFGSYGWSGEAGKIMDDNLKNLKLKPALDNLSVKFFPHDEKSDLFIDFGKRFGQAMLEQ
ncbi:MAG: FprA family A-type flavoprotein [Bacteroidales bacterium]|nr:FprA family A-type flavoprotein [Bacteroidales bacterium]MCF8390237.1 FprA family A-type flavoprotein [Bacteroidales bacterium]